MNLVLSSIGLTDALILLDNWGIAWFVHCTFICKDHVDLMNILLWSQYCHNMNSRFLNICHVSHEKSCRCILIYKFVLYPWVLFTASFVIAIICYNQCAYQKWILFTTVCLVQYFSDEDYKALLIWSLVLWLVFILFFPSLNVTG